MLPADRDIGHVWDIVEAGGHLSDAIAGLDYDLYSHDVQLRWTVERGLTIVGEAARRLSAGFRDAHPEIAWPKIIALRNIIVHEYDELDPKRVWDVASLDIPNLITALRPLLPPPTIQPQ